jgi:hypothetical protein
MCDSFGLVKSLRGCNSASYVSLLSHSSPYFTLLPRKSFPCRAGPGQGADEILFVKLTNRQAIVEYWDSRAAVDLFENMNGKPFEGGTLDMKYIWDEPPPGQ